MALISFDLDGVLQRNPFRSDRHDGVFGHIKRELAPHVPDQPDAEAAASAVLRIIMTEHQTRLRASQLVEAHDWDDIVAGLSRRLGYTGQMNIAELVATYVKRPELSYPYPGARECLEALAGGGHTLICITNGFRNYQEPVLRHHGLFGFFKEVYTPDAVRAAKPQGEIFEAAEALAAAGETCVHVGDTLPHDVAGAKRAGWKAIYIVQMGAPGATELPPALASLPPAQRPAAGTAWLRGRLERDRHWHGYPPAELEECVPDAIVSSLGEVPGAVKALL